MFTEIFMAHYIIKKMNFWYNNKITYITERIHEQVIGN
jgi:hypothetical protein